MVLDIQLDSAFEWVLLSVSDVFRRGRIGQLASLSGGGVVVSPILSPGGMLGLNVAVTGCDARTPDVGRSLENALTGKRVSRAGSALQEAVAAIQPALAMLMNVLTDDCSNALKRNRVDALLAHNHGGLDLEEYGAKSAAEPGAPYSGLRVEYDRPFVSLRVRRRK